MDPRGVRRDLTPAGPVCSASMKLHLVDATFELFRAYYSRPTEHGPKQTTDLAPTGRWDFVAKDFIELAKAMGC